MNSLKMNENETQSKKKTDKLTTQKKPRIQSEGLWLRNMSADKISNTKKTRLISMQRKIIALALTSC